MTYTCNAIHKKSGRLHFCILDLSHEGDHTDNDQVWPQELFDDEGVPPVW